jgi:hypothetical protein
MWLREQTDTHNLWGIPTEHRRAANSFAKGYTCRYYIDGLILSNLLHALAKKWSNQERLRTIVYSP